MLQNQEISLEEHFRISVRNILKHMPEGEMVVVGRSQSSIICFHREFHFLWLKLIHFLLILRALLIFFAY